MQNPQVKTVIGHSLAGSVALELQKNYPHITSSRTYAAPVLDLTGREHGKVDRYHNWFGPISILDRSASRNIKWNLFGSSSLTHDYTNLADKFTSSTQIPASTENPDTSISLIG